MKQAPAPAMPQGPQPQEDQAPQGDPQTQLITNVDKAIDHLSMIIGQAQGAPPEAKQLIQMIDQAFGKLMSTLGMGEGESEEEGPGEGQGQTVPQEAGGNKGAIPSPM